MTLCVAMLIASEFMPVSLLTPIVTDLQATEGHAGQAISISGLFAVVASLLIANVAGRFDRGVVLMALTVVLLAALAFIATAPNFAVPMAARALGRDRRRILGLGDGDDHALRSGGFRAEGARCALHG